MPYTMQPHLAIHYAVPNGVLLVKSCPTTLREIKDKTHRYYESSSIIHSVHLLAQPLIPDLALLCLANNSTFHWRHEKCRQ